MFQLVLSNNIGSLSLLFLYNLNIKKLNNIMQLFLEINFLVFVFLWIESKMLPFCLTSGRLVATSYWQVDEDG